MFSFYSTKLVTRNISFLNVVCKQNIMPLYGMLKTGVSTLIFFQKDKGTEDYIAMYLRQVSIDMMI